MTPSGMFEIANLTKEHREWLSTLEFYEHELNVLLIEMNEVPENQKKSDLKQTVNALIFDSAQLRKQIDHHEKSLAADDLRADHHVSNHTMAHHDYLKQETLNVESRFKDLREKTQQFLVGFRSAG